VKGLDICDVCHRSAVASEGQTDFVPTPDDWFKQQVSDFEYRFVCKECVERKAAN
jgi:hypothetical protein